MANLVYIRLSHHLQAGMPLNSMHVVDTVEGKLVEQLTHSRPTAIEHDLLLHLQQSCQYIPSYLGRGFPWTNCFLPIKISIHE